MYETIKPAKTVCEALEFLRHTSLYIKNNIKINDEFFKKYNKNFNAVLDFIVDNKCHSYTNVINRVNLEEHNNNSDSEESVSFEPIDEVLIVDRNKEISENIEIKL